MDSPKGHQCHTCGIQFPRASSLKDHMRYHAGPEFQCRQCEKLFHTKGDLNDHVSHVHENKQHVCEECGKVYHSRGALFNHCQLHRSKYTCVHCNKAFAHKQHLESHREVHRGTAPCKKCGKLFLHVSVHEKKCGKPKPAKVSCKVCDKLFKEKRYLTEHMKHVHGPKK